MRHLAPFRRRLVAAPLGIGHPCWLEDPDFDLDRHLCRIPVPAPGGERELADVVALIARQRLDRSLPLWQLWTVEGLAGCRTALVIKAHHALVDGVAGAGLLARLLDLPAFEGSDAEPDPWTPEALPSTSELMSRSLRRLAREPRAGLERARRGGRAALRIARTVLAESQQAGPFVAPRTPFNTEISPFRSVAYSRTPIDALRLAKEAFGVTLNETILTACSMSLREWLLAQDALPDRPLVAAVPVSTRAAQADSDGNALSALLVSLPVQLDDPVEQLLAVRESSRQAKRLHRLLGEDSLRALAESAPPLLARALAQVYSAGLAAAHPPLYNLVISNVPGPPSALSFAGARVRAIHPHGPVFTGAGLNLTVLSYAGSIDFGAIACRRSVPRLTAIAQGFAGAAAQLGRLAAAEIRRRSEMEDDVADVA